MGYQQWQTLINVILGTFSFVTGRKNEGLIPVISEKNWVWSGNVNKKLLHFLLPALFNVDKSAD